MALALLSDTDGTDGADTLADLAAQTRLLGAIDALNQATGMTLMQTVVKENMAALREQIQRAGLENIYREGRTLSFRAIVSLAMAQVDTIERAFT
jgi:hypothetical protein